MPSGGLTVLGSSMTYRPLTASGAGIFSTAALVLKGISSVVARLRIILSASSTCPASMADLTCLVSVSMASCVGFTPLLETAFNILPVINASGTTLENIPIKTLNGYARYGWSLATNSVALLKGKSAIALTPVLTTCLPNVFKPCFTPYLIPCFIAVLAPIVKPTSAIVAGSNQGSACIASCPGVGAVGGADNVVGPCNPFVGNDGVGGIVTG